MSSIAKQWSDMTPINHVVAPITLTDFVGNGLSRSTDVNVFTQLRVVALKAHVKCGDI